MYDLTKIRKTFDELIMGRLDRRACGIRLHL